jgi:hypothetical protein
MLQKILFLCLFIISSLISDTEIIPLEEETDNAFFYQETPQTLEKEALNFGLGLGAIFLSKADVLGTTVDNGTVRVIDEESQKLGVWLTTSWVNGSWPSNDIKIGPFVGIQLGGNKAFLNSLAVGLDLSFMKVKYGLPLDFQLGWAWTRTTQLANGYADNATLPAGSNTVLTKEVISNGFVFITSYKF